MKHVEIERRKQSHTEKMRKRDLQARDAVNLFMRGYTVWEICTIMNLKESTVRSLLA